jgi:hypothetical protein
MILIYMSEATLKRKSRTLYNNLSVNMNGFSINGTRRSQGYIGQTSLGRSLPKTLMRGNVVRGSGGCCGTYYQGPIVKSAVPFPSNSSGESANNNPNIVKSSVLGTTGMIMTKYRWIRRPQPFTSVKINSSLTNNSQSTYIAEKSADIVNSLNSCNVVSGTPQINCCPETYNKPFGSVINYTRPYTVITKSQGALSQSAFLAALKGKCNFKPDTSINVCREPILGSV